MPSIRTLRPNTALDNVPFSAFEEVQRQIAREGGPDFAPLHQGKTSFPPCVGPTNWGRADFELAAHEHAPPAGTVTLKRRAVDHLARRSLRRTTEECVVVTCGATHAVTLALHAILEPGDEVLVLSPQWLFASGLVHAAGGRTVEVPVFLELERDPSFDFIGALEARRTERTKAIYFNSPNNPTGYSMDVDAHAALADFADRFDLWIVADNAYEIYDFTSHGFIDIAALPGAGDRTFSVYTLSKTYAMPGYRVGFVVAPERMAAAMRKWGLYSVYAVSTASQFAAVQALATPDEVLNDRRRGVLEARDLVHDRLDVPHTRTHGGLYTLLDLSGWPSGRDDFLVRAIRAGVSLAPGEAFGRHCTNHARMCFTAVPVERLESAIDRLNRLWQEAAS
jgi:aspartate aminotransferase